MTAGITSWNQSIYTSQLMNQTVCQPIEILSYGRILWPSAICRWSQQSFPLLPFVPFQHSIHMEWSNNLLRTLYEDAWLVWSVPVMFISSRGWLLGPPFHNSHQSTSPVVEKHQTREDNSETYCCWSVISDNCMQQGFKATYMLKGIKTSST